MGKHVSLTAADSFKLGGYRANPASKPKGAVVVIQEIFGVNKNIRATCDGFAQQGYVAIAPALFDRTSKNFESGYSPEEVAEARKFIANPDLDAMLRDTQAAIDEVKSAGPVGIGDGFGRRGGVGLGEPFHLPIMLQHDPPRPPSQLDGILKVLSQAHRAVGTSRGSGAESHGRKVKPRAMRGKGKA